MNPDVLAYNFVSEIEGLIEKIKKDFSQEELSSLRLVLPSMDDKLWLPYKNISDEYLWTWDEIYKNVCEAGQVKRKRILSPPDRLLILDSIK